jgi:GNAT superfamily N-acetyltransferase
VAARIRACTGPEDLAAISDFLYGLYEPDNRDGNWLQPMWEWVYPWFDDESVQRIGIWDDAGEIAAVVMYEQHLGEAFFQTDRAHAHLKPEMLAHAERHLAATRDDGTRYLKAYVNDFDTAFEDVVRSRGYVRGPGGHRPMLQFAIPRPFQRIHLPDGFVLKSLADSVDLAEVGCLLWRGFENPGEPSDAHLEAWKQVHPGPHFRADLTIIVEAPGGEPVSFAGLWFDPVNKIGYVEPVATDPDYRRMGLATAAMLEGIRRCAELGATVAYVVSDLPVYFAMGFEKLFSLDCWVKDLPSE